MVELLEKEEWDLSPIINLINSLSASDDVHLATDVQSCHSKDIHYAPLSKVQDEEKSYLGNFDVIWKFLGQPCDVAPPKINPSLKIDPYIFSGPADIQVIGDDSNNDNSNAKAVRWRDEAEGADLEDNDQLDGPNPLINGSSLTKSQKKRQRQKLQKDRKDKANCTAQLFASGVQSDSISDTENNDQHDGQNLMTNNSGLTVLQQRKQRRKLKRRLKSAALCTAQLSASGIQSDSVADTEDNAQQDGQYITINGLLLKMPHKKKERKRLQKEGKYEALGTAQLSASGIQSDSTVEQQSKTRRALIQQITNSTPARVHSTPLSEDLSQAFVRNCRRNGIAVGNNTFPLIRTQSVPIISAVPPTISFREVNLLVAATKKGNLLLKLKAQFADERPFLENLAVVEHITTGNEVSVNGIHVFVDISNVGSLQIL